MNPIKYTDLFGSEVNQGLQTLIADLKQAREELEKMLTLAKSEASALKQALAAANPGTITGREDIVRLSQAIEQQTEKITKLTEAKKKNAEATKTAKSINQMFIDQIEEIYTAEKIATASYNELSQAYAQGKIQVNAMTAATKEEIATREKAQATLRKMYEQMNLLQQQTGKYTLQVGNYQKSWNGLNLAFQQIIRETPNMAMGFNTFFLAISNNLPILADQIKLAKDKYAADMANIEAMKAEGAAQEAIDKAMKETIPVGKQILKSLFSWQTAMTLGVTLLTLFGGKIIDAISKLSLFNGKLNEGKIFNEQYAKSLEDSTKAGEEAASQLHLLYKEATDLNASMEDRLGAVKDLKALWPDVFSGLSNEAILVGNAKAQYDLLAESITRTAMAEAAYNQIRDIAASKVAAELALQEANKFARDLGYADIADLEANTVSLTSQGRALASSVRGPVYGGMSHATDRTGEMQKQVDAFRQAERTIKEADTKMEAIRKMMEDNDLFGFAGKTNAGSGKDSIGDNYWAMIAEQLGNVPDGLVKEALKINADFAKLIDEIDGKRKDIQKKLAKGTLSAEDRQNAQQQLMYLEEQIAAANANRQKALWEAVSKYNQKIVDKYVAGEVAEENTNVIRDRIKKSLDMEAQFIRAEIYDRYAKGELNYDQLQEMLKQADRTFWISLREEYEKNGVLFASDIEEITKHLVEKPGKKKSWIQKLLGLDDEEFKNWAKFLRELAKVFRETINQINEIVEGYKAKAEAAREAAQAEVDASKTVYEAELEAYKNGYANNVEYARKELELRKKKEAEAAAEVKKYEQIQERLNSLSQASSLVTASASLFKAAAPLGAVGVGIATAATAAMFGAFASAKIQAAKAAGVTKYGNGMHEYLDYGGTHASGNDIDFGVGKDGKRRRVERGEMIAVFNARNTRKYGAGNLADLVDAINAGTFDTMMGGAFGGNINVNVDSSSPYLASMDRNIEAIRKNGEKVSYFAGNGTIVEKYRNRTRIKHLN